MKPSLLEAPSSRDPWGFSCKIWLAYQLEKQYFGQVYYAWFARELNPLENGDSSNPLEIYASVDKAVKKSDANHPKLKNFRASLLETINRLVSKKDPKLARELRREILRAPVEMFRPSIWRIDLSKIAVSRVHTDKSQAGWDEQYIADLTDSEFEVIVP